MESHVRCRLQFSSLEPDVLCRLVYVKDVELSSQEEDTQQQAPPGRISAKLVPSHVGPDLLVDCNVVMLANCRTDRATNLPCLPGKTRRAYQWSSHHSKPLANACV